MVVANIFSHLSSWEQREQGVFVLLLFMLQGPTVFLFIFFDFQATANSCGVESFKEKWLNQQLTYVSRQSLTSLCD